MNEMGRREFLRGSAGALTGTALLYGTSLRTRAQSSETWPQFGYDNANTGHAPDNNGPIDNIEQQWAFETGDEVWSSPAVADGIVYVGRFDNNVYALDATDGTEQWAFEIPNSVASSPALKDETVYIGGGSDLYALDAADGTEQWRFGTGDLVGSSPTVVDDVIYFGSNDNIVHALDASDGTEQWAFETGDSVTSSPTVVISTVTIGQYTVYIGSEDNTVYALDARDGTEQWTFETGDSIVSSPTMMNGTVYVGSYDGNVYALDAANGTEQWAHETTDAVWSSPTVMDDTVYVGGWDNWVYALDATDGSREWAFETNDRVASSPAVVDDTVYIGSYDGKVYALDTNEGEPQTYERWVRGTDGQIFSSPAVANGTVYVGSKDGKIYALTGETSTATATPTQADSNEPPTASITVSPSDPQPGGPVRFDASDSTDPDGSITSYEWEVSVEKATGGGGGNAQSGVVADSGIPSDGGTVRAELTVRDDDGATDTTTRTVSSTAEQEGGSGSVDTLSLLAGLGTLGVAGGGAWWYRRRNSTDTESGDEQSDDDSTGGTAGSTSRTTASSGGTTGGESGGDSGSPLAQTSTATRTMTSTSSRGNAKSSADSGHLETAKKLLDEGDTRRDEASDYRAAGEYGRALDTYNKAQEAYEEALERGSESDLIDVHDIEQGLAAVKGARQEVYRQRLQEEIESLRSELDHAGTLADDGNFEEAQEMIEDHEIRLASTKETATQRDLDNLQDEIATLERRREERLTDLTERGEAHPIPKKIPRAPDVSVDPDALTDEEPIGGGGNADVIKAALPTPDGDVTLAIKRPRMAGTLHTNTVEQMLDEAETWDRLDDHDQIVGVVDYGSKPIPWIAMEYMDGGDLGERSGEIEVPQALWTALAVTKGVRHAHRRGVAHLDLKPQNVLFRTVENAWDVPKVADWGLSKHLLEHSKSVEGMSVEYAAPEQFDEDYGTTDDITDVYQLGAVFYELFTGRPPFEGQPFKVIDKVKADQPTPPSEIADVPDAVSEILLTALAKDKADRYDDIIYLRDDLEELLDNW